MLEYTLLRRERNAIAVATATFTIATTSRSTICSSYHSTHLTKDNQRGRRLL